MNLPGINIYGYVYAEHGVGQVARQVIECARHAGIEFAVIPYTDTGSRQQATVAEPGGREPVHDVNVIVVNADSLPAFVERFGPEVLAGRYNIGIWAWEIDTIPDELARSARFLDEVWGISRFTSDAIARSVSCPVRTFSLPHTFRQPIPRSRGALGLGDEFMFLFCFDFNSLFDRKNPLALIEAFQRAFRAEESVVLVIKTLNGRHFSDELERLNAAALPHPRVRVVDGYLSSEEQQALMASCDAYVSLHRSEGFGLTLLEAMAYGKPVIATGYSGNLDFMNERNGYLVPYRMTGLPERCGPYPPTAQWADPDLEVAARLMRRVVERPDEAGEKARQAKLDVESLHTPRERGRLIRERLVALRDVVEVRRSSRPPRPANGRHGGSTEPPADTPPPASGSFTSFSTVRELLAAQLVRFDEHRVDPDLACGSLDGGMLDPSGGASVWGWAYDPRTRQPASSVILILNGRQVAIRIPVDAERPDVAAFLGDPALAACGWSLYLPPQMLGPAPNAVSAYAVFADGRLARLPGAEGGELVLKRRRRWSFLDRLRRSA